MLKIEFIKLKMNDFLKTILGIIIFVIFIVAIISIADEKNKESFCPEADCYTEIWP